MENTHEVAPSDVSTPDVDTGEAVNPVEQRRLIAEEMLRESGFNENGDDSFDESYDEVEEDQSPGDAEADEQDDNQVSVDDEEGDEPSQEEQDSTDDENPDVETDEDAGDDEEVGAEDGGEYNLLSFDDFKGFRLELDGKHYDGAQLKSFINNASKTSKAQEQVKTREEAVEAREQKSKAFDEYLRSKATTSAKRNQMDNLANQFAQIDRKLASLDRNAPDYNETVGKATQAKELLSQQYDALESQAVEEESKADELHWARQEEFLTKHNRMDIIENEDTIEANSKFAAELLDDEAFEFAKKNGSMMMVIDMARQGKVPTKVETKPRQNKTLPKGRKVNADAAEKQKTDKLARKARDGKLSDREASNLRNSHVQAMLKESDEFGY